jgi:hypothetical protein
VTTRHVYVLHAKTNQRFLKLPLFARFSETELAADNAGVQDGGASAPTSQLGDLLARARGSGGVVRGEGDAGRPQMPALSVNTHGVVLEVSVLAGRLAGRGIAVLCITSDEAGLLRRAITAALRGVSEPARLVEAERAAAAKQRAATRATLEALAIARDAQARALLAEAASCSTRLFRARVLSVTDEQALHSSHARASAAFHERAFVICASLDALQTTALPGIRHGAWRVEHEGWHDKQHGVLEQHVGHKERIEEGGHGRTARHTRIFAAIADVWRRIPPALRGAPALPAGGHADSVCAGLRLLLEALRAEARAHEAELCSATLLLLEAPPAPPSVTGGELSAAAEAVLDFLFGTEF